MPENHNATSIHIAILRTNMGRRGFAALTENELRRQVADYARNNWKLEGVPGRAPKSDDLAIERYFDYMGDDETIIFETADLTGVVKMPNPAPATMLSPKAPGM